MPDKKSNGAAYSMPSPPTGSARQAGTSARFPRGFYSLGGRILFWMSLVALAPLLIMAYQGYQSARQAVIESAVGHLRSVLESRTARLESKLSEIQSDFAFLADTHFPGGFCCGIIDGSGGICTREGCNLLDSLRKRSPYYQMIAVYDDRWKILFHSSGGEQAPDDAFSQAFKSSLIGKEDFMLFPSQPHGDGGLCVHAGRPIKDQQSMRTYYIAACVNLSQAVESILGDRSGLYATGKIFLLSPEGFYLAVPPQTPGLLGRKSGIPAALMQLNSFDADKEPESGWSPEKQSRSEFSPDIYVYDDDRGVRVIGASAVIPELNWVVVGQIDQAEAFAWLRILRRRALITGSITLVIVLAIAAIRSRKLSRPLRELAAVSRKIARGNHEERLGDMEGLEAREVGLAFNQMLDELDANHKRLMHTASLAAVGELSSSVVHEMRNPLSSIKMNLQALQRKVKGDKTYTELADIALNQVGRLEQMLSDLLGYGKPLRLNLSDVRFRDLAADAVEMVRKDMEDKNVTVEIRDRLGELTFPADPEQIQRALTNLVTNAVQAVPPSGTVIISGEVRAGVPERAVISIMDNGPGIPEIHREKLFQPFFTSREGGTGLGLANVKKIVDYHGGTVEAENRPEGGAVFTLSFKMGERPS